MEDKRLQKINNKNYRATIIGTFAGLVGVSLTLLFFFYKEKPSLDISTVSCTNVLDINASLSSMDILLDSTSLKQTNENIKVYTIRIANNGSANITTELFDPHVPIGLKVENGYMLDPPELIAASNPYLESCKIKSNRREFSLPPLILDSKDYMDVKLLIVHKNDVIPELKPFGKISGQREIVLTDHSDATEIPFLIKTFGGNIYIQCARLIAYFLFYVLVLIAVIQISEWTDNLRKRNRRKRLVKRFKERIPNSDNDFILDIYKQHGRSKIQKYVNVLGSTIEHISECFENPKESDLDLDSIKELIELKVINKKGNNWSFNKSKREQILSVFRYIFEHNGRSFID